MIEQGESSSSVITTESTGKTKKYDQGVYWIITLKYQGNEDPAWRNRLPEQCNYLLGQREVGGKTGYEHWQMVVGFKRSLRKAAVKKIFGKEAHVELTISEKAEDYCQKGATKVEGTEFSLGKKPMKRNSKRDYEEIYELAKQGRLEEIDKQVLVCHYNSLKRIMIDNMQAEECLREVRVYWGDTGLGKSRKAWEEATFDAYPKDPNTKFWDGYRGQENVVIDEFRGLISISHLLRWLDRYPVCVETKGSGCVLRARRIWITSNLDPRLWYKDLDISTQEALLRRLTITHFTMNMYPFLVPEAVQQNSHGDGESEQ